MKQNVCNVRSWLHLNPFYWLYSNIVTKPLMSSGIPIHDFTHVDYVKLSHLNLKLLYNLCYGLWRGFVYYFIFETTHKWCEKFKYSADEDEHVFKTKYNRNCTIMFAFFSHICQCTLTFFLYNIYLNYHISFLFIMFYNKYCIRKI